MTTTPKGSFVGAARQYFGLKEGQSLGGEGGFSEELKALTPQDRIDMAHGLVGVGQLTTDGLEKEQAREGADGLTPAPGY